MRPFAAIRVDDFLDVAVERSAQFDHAIAAPRRFSDDGGEHLRRLGDHPVLVDRRHRLAP